MILFIEMRRRKLCRWLALVLLICMGSDLPSNHQPRAIFFRWVFQRCLIVTELLKPTKPFSDGPLIKATTAPERKPGGKDGLYGPSRQSSNWSVFRLLYIYNILICIYIYICDMEQYADLISSRIKTAKWATKNPLTFHEMLVGILVMAYLNLHLTGYFMYFCLPYIT